MTAQTQPALSQELVFSVQVFPEAPLPGKNTLDLALGCGFAHLNERVRRNLVADWNYTRSAPDHAMAVNVFCSSLAIDVIGEAQYRGLVQAAIEDALIGAIGQDNFTLT